VNVEYEARLSDSPYVERIWRTQSANSSLFTSLAFSNWFIVLWKQQGKNNIAIHGPETRAIVAEIPEYADFLGIVFKHGTFMPDFPISNLVNSEIALPEAASQSFWLNGSAWQFPDFNNIDTFINRLVKHGLLVRESIVDAAIYGQIPDLSSRSIQRRILRTTGLTYNTIRQIERARRAAILLQEGTSILDTVFQTGYADQSHLTRSFKHFIGQTPTRIADISKRDQLSFLFKTTDTLMDYDAYNAT
jgi:AraC-like DNA-binding protein